MWLVLSVAYAIAHASYIAHLRVPSQAGTDNKLDSPRTKMKFPSTGWQEWPRLPGHAEPELELEPESAAPSELTLEPVTPRIVKARPATSRVSLRQNHIAMTIMHTHLYMA